MLRENVILTPKCNPNNVSSAFTIIFQHSIRSCDYIDYKYSNDPAIAGCNVIFRPNKIEIVKQDIGNQDKTFSRLSGFPYLLKKIPAGVFPCTCFGNLSQSTRTWHDHIIMTIINIMCNRAYGVSILRNCIIIGPV